MVKFLELQAYIDGPANGDADAVQPDDSAPMASASAQDDGLPAGAASADGLELKTGQTEKADQMAYGGMFPGDSPKAPGLRTDYSYKPHAGEISLKQPSLTSSDSAKTETVCEADRISVMEVSDSRLLQVMRGDAVYGSFCEGRDIRLS